MRIAILNTHVPFVRGGAEELADGLVAALRAHGHAAEVVRVPFLWYPPQRIVEHMLAAQMMRIANADRVIGLKFPAYLVPHEDKRLWVTHQHRQAYDLWGTVHQDIPDTPDGRAVRASVIRTDDALLESCGTVYTISGVTAARMLRFNGVSAEVLYPPVVGADRYTDGTLGDYLFCPGRLSVGKRQDLVLASMRHVRSDVRLVVAGAYETPDDRRRLRSLLDELDLTGRVELIDRWLTEDEKVSLMNGALGCVYVPYDEDYGYVTVEAFHAGKAVITCEDSGGPLEFVRDGVTGYVAPAEPEALAEAFDRLASDRSQAARLGASARELLSALDLNWDHVVARLAE